MEKEKVSPWKKNLIHLTSVKASLLQWQDKPTGTLPCIEEMFFPPLSPHRQWQFERIPLALQDVL